MRPLDPREQDLARRLAAAGAQVRPPQGARERLLARAAAAAPAPAPRAGFAWPRLAPAAGVLAALVLTTGGVAYAAPADAPTFPVQRALDGVALAAPLPAGARIQLATAVAERRADQAAAVASRAPSTLVAELLGDVTRLFDQARATARSLAPAERAAVFGALADAQRRAAADLAAEAGRAQGESRQLLERTGAEMEQEAEQDDREREAPEPSERPETSGAPKPGGTPERKSTPEPAESGD